MYDLIILGAGPAGLSAAIYASRFVLKTLIIGNEVGGMINYAHKVENYPGLISLTGMELAEKMKEQALKLGAELKEEEIKGIRKKEDHFEINGKYKSKKIIIALGTQRKKLDITGEKEFLGKGVSYCATCDALFFREKNVGVVGGGNSAADATLMLSEIAKKVFLIYRGEELKAEPKRIELIQKNGKIEIIYSSNITEISGEKMMKKVMMDTGKELELDGLFIEIGSVPSTIIAKELGINLDEKGYMIVNQKQATKVTGVFAAGDITTNSNNFRQVITAAAEGAIAARSVYEEIKQ